MSVNQTTAADDVSAAIDEASAQAGAVIKSAEANAGVKAPKADRTDMVGKALGLLVLLGDEPKGASAAEI
ncbi:IclR family transcriptional regulator, partial [Arthrobacter sp. HMWF013]